jgi:hypothetical protein
MCPGVTLAMREKQPFIQVFKHFLKSEPFENHMRVLQAQLRAHGVNTKIFRSIPYHQWFMCMWTSKKRNKLQQQAEQYDAVIVLGCESAAETVRDVVKPISCRVIEGMEPTGIMNAKMRFHLPCNVSFEDCKIIPRSNQKSNVSALN